MHKMKLRPMIIILVHISFLTSANIELIFGLEERLKNTSFSLSLQDQLLLVYGGLAMKGKKEVEFRVLDELIGDAWITTTLLSSSHPFFIRT